jgi:hypothetical protein
MVPVLRRAVHGDIEGEPVIRGYPEFAVVSVKSILPAMIRSYTACALANRL